MIRSPRRRVPVAGAVAAVALLAGLAGCGGDDSSSSATTTTPHQTATIVLDWYPNVDHAGILAAKTQGFFDDAGVTVRTQVPSDPAASLKQVAAGKVPFAVSYEPEVLVARSQGLPVVAVGAIVQQPLNAVMVRADRGVTRPRQLAGRTVGAAGVPSDRPLLDAVVRADGGDPAAVTMRNVGFSLSPALAAGKVDAVIGAYWNVEKPELERTGTTVTVLKLEEHGVPNYDELVLVTSEKTIAQKPDLVRAVLTGLALGQTWVGEHPAETVTMLKAANKDLNAAVLPQQVALTAPLLDPKDAAPLAIDPAEWGRFATWMRQKGLLTKDVDGTKAANASFLPAG